MDKYDVAIIGAGLYGAMCAYTERKKGKKVLVVDKSSHIGGMCHTDNINGIDVHCFGAHIFRTDNKKVWDFVNSVSKFVPFINTPIAVYGNEQYNLPFNMNTFRALFGCSSPSEAAKIIESTTVPCDDPQNLEEFVLSKVGTVIYEKLIKHYTEKQWGRKCSELPVSTMARIPVRFTYNNNYYNVRWQGVCQNGYDYFISELLKGCDILLGVDYKSDFSEINSHACEIMYTGAIDELFDYELGTLDWRAVRFETAILPDVDNKQGVAVMNYTDDRPYTRTIEHKHFTNKDCRGTVVSFEFPCETSATATPSYPIINERNKSLHNEYIAMSKAKFPNIKHGGRLGEYKYYSMDEIIEKFI